MEIGGIGETRWKWLVSMMSGCLILPGERGHVYPQIEGNVDPGAGVGMEMERFISFLGIQAQPFSHHTTWDNLLNVVKAPTNSL